MANYIEKIHKLFSIKHQLVESVYEENKKASKKIAEELGIPFVKEFSDVSVNLILKNSYNRNGDITIIKSGEVLQGKYDTVEELIVDANGQVPPRSFQIYVCNHTPKLIEIKNKLYNQFSYYDIDWNYLNGITNEKNTIEHVKPKHFYKMMDIASGLSRKFNFPVRIDCFMSHDEVYFHDCSLTPNIINTLTDRGNELLGKGWHEHFIRKGIRDEFSVRERPEIFKPKYHVMFS